MNKQDLSPSDVVIHLVLKWASKIGQIGTATIRDGSLTFSAKNHRGDFVTMSTPVHFDGKSQGGVSPRFMLVRIGATVWTLVPSVLAENIHAFITVIGVPDPPPWETTTIKICPTCRRAARHTAIGCNDICHLEEP
jgi:hypothetical protein